MVHSFFFDKGKVVFFSNEGMLATNKKIYISSPTKTDLRIAATKLTSRKKKPRSVQHPLYPPLYTKKRKSSYKAI